MAVTLDRAALMQSAGNCTVQHLEESTYGKFREVSVMVLEGDVPGVLASGPTVTVPKDAFTQIGPKKGIGRTITVTSDGETVAVPWTVRGVLPHADAGLIVLELSETTDA